MLAPEPPRFAPNSSREYLSVTKTSIDFSLPSSSPASGDAAVPHYEYLPLACSSTNMLFFTRGNRLHYKNPLTSEDIGQLFKLQEKYGDIQVVQCGGVDQSNTLAVSTSKGYIHIWDVASKKATMSWHTRDVGTMQWNGPVLTVGEVKGTIRFFDTRISPVTKMKGEARKLIRHQTRITHLSWNENKKYLATGDDSGTVYCWDDRQKSPLDVGEFVQRRKKIQHEAPVTALAWCPWQSRYLGTGDANGTIRLWSIDPEETRPNTVGPHHTIRTGSCVTGLHFSSQCKEMISIHGKEADTLPWESHPLMQRSIPTPTANSIVAHTFPNSRHVKTLAVSDKPLAGSVLVGSGMKVIVAIPEEGKLKLYDVWGKPPPLKRQPSLVDKAMSSIR
ncbi:WD40 repeat-like protein [Marasmius fiardii PR-910]|nr:WD40 repeat-like protein [Marasmius fiardii PR-910]